MELIEQYFPELTPEQHDQLAALDDLYHEWNAKINVISRKDIDNLYLHHVLHSLAIGKFLPFKPGRCGNEATSRTRPLGSMRSFPS